MKARHRRFAWIGAGLAAYAFSLQRLGIISLRELIVLAQQRA